VVGDVDGGGDCALAYSYDLLTVWVTGVIREVRGSREGKKERADHLSISLPFSTMEEVARFLPRRDCDQLATCSKQLCAAIEPRLY